MGGERDQGVKSNRQAGAECRQQGGIDDAADEVRVLGEIAEILQRQRLERIDALAPAADEGAQQHAGERQADRHEQPKDDAGERHPAPGTEPQRPRLHALAAHGDVALGHAQQMALQIDERQRHQHNGDHHDSH